MSDTSINAHIDGDVSGSVNIAGRDVINNVTYIQQIAATQPDRFVPPFPPAKLIGRSAQFEAIKVALNEGQPVVLHGLGGMGKTALAQTIAADAFSNLERYSGGVLWITVLGRSLEDLCDEVFRRLGDLESVKLPADQKPPLLKDRLGNRRLMIVLDDIDEGSTTARDWLRDAHPAATPLLVTSRETQPKFKLFDITELDRADAIALLRHHAKRVNDKLTDEIADQICSALGDHPLAVEIMGALLNERPMDLAKVPEELKEAYKALKNIKIGDKKDENVYASMELSWQRLDDDQRLVLARLAACFAPRTGDELLSMCCELDTDRYRAATRTLFSQSLIREHSNQWAIHTLVIIFVEAMIGEASWDWSCRAVVRGCVTYAKKNKAYVLVESALLDAERISLLGAAIWAADSAMYQEVNQIAWELNNNQFLDMHGYARDAQKLLEVAINASQILGDRQSEAGHLTSLGLSCAALGQITRAITLYEQALTISREIESRDGEANNLSNLGLAYRAQGQVDKAIRLFEQALIIDRELGDRRREGITLGNLGLAFATWGQVDKAIDYYLQQLTISREFLDWISERNALGNLGNAYSYLGYKDEAIDCYQQVLTIDRTIGDRRDEAVAIGNLGVAYLDLMQIDKAQDSIQQQLMIVREIGDRRGESNALFNLGNIYYVLRDGEHAISLYEQALVIFSEVGDRYGEGQALVNMASTYRELNYLERAMDLYEQALSFVREIGDRHTEGLVLLNLGIVYKVQGKVREAITNIEQARNIFFAIKSPLSSKCERMLAQLTDPRPPNPNG